MDVEAENYALEAVESDGSCTYISGCADPEALNFNYQAKKDDGSCTYIKRIIFYSKGAWANSNETAASVMVYEENSSSRIGTINSFSSAIPSNCINMRSSSQLVISDVGLATSKNYYAIMSYSYLDDFSNYRSDSRRVEFKIDIPTTNSYCEFYAID